MWRLRGLLRLRLFQFSSKASLPAGEDAIGALDSSRELAVLRSFTQLLSWSENEADYSTLACRLSLDGTTSDHRARQTPGVPVGSSAHIAIMDQIQPASLDAYLTATSRGLQPMDITQTMEAKGMTTQKTTIGALVDADEESVVVTAVDACDRYLFTNGGNTACHCELDEEPCSPDTKKVILDSSLAEDPQIAEWLNTAFGIHR